MVGPAYTSRELPISAQVTKGLFPEVHPEGKTFASLNTFPGLKPFATLSGADRGLHVFNGILHAVSGETLYSVDSSGADTSIGTVLGSGRCDFADNGTQMMITTGATPYVYTDTLAEIEDDDLYNPTTVGYLNAQFIYDQNNGDSGEFVTSAVGDGTDISALDFAQAESHPDDILRIIVHSQLVYFFGSQTIEPWYNSGVSRPPFNRVQGGVKPYGLAGPRAADTSGELIYFLDQNRVPRRLSGLAVDNIARDYPSLGTELSRYTDVSDCIVYAYTLDNQNFAQFNFPTADRSWLYHEQSNSWAQLSYGVDDARHRGNSYAYAYGKHIVADHSNGKLYELDFDTFTDNGEVVHRQRTTATIHSGLYDQPGKPVFYERVYLDVQTGQGLTTGQGVEPLLMVKYSDDRGRTWSAEEHYPLGAGGEYLTRVEMHQQGQAFERIYDLSFSDPTRFTLMSAHADIELGQ